MADKEKPNILWICTDQQRFDTLGAYGNDIIDTPNLDKLAAEGVLFENCYSQSPVCTPSRASFLTGRYPRTTGCRQNGQALPQKEEDNLVTKILSDQGYIGGLSGKLHIAPAHPYACSGTEKRLQDGYDVFHWSHDPNDIWPTNQYNSWLRKKGLTYNAETAEESDYVNYGMKEENHQTTWCVEKAKDFIRAGADFDYPWFFSLNIFDPHHSFDPPRRYLQKYIDKIKEIPEPNYSEGELEDKPVFQKIDHRGAYGGNGFDYEAMSNQDHKLVRAAYWAMIDLIDHQIGRLLDQLEKTGQLENTMVIFTSDHGEMLGDHGIYWKGPYFYEPAVHVPLIISYPDHFQSGVSSQALVELTDLAPTLLEAAAIEIPEGVQGKSLYSMLKGDSSLNQHRETVYSEYYNAMSWHQDPTPYGTMVYNGRYKLVKMHGLDQGELYDLQKDPRERNNLWGQQHYQDLKTSMLELLSDRIAFTMDPLPEKKALW